MTPAPVFVLAIARVVIAGDWTLAKRAAREAVLARVSPLVDDRHDVALAEVPRPTGHELRQRLDADEQLSGCIGFR